MFDFSLRRTTLIAVVALLIPVSAAVAAPSEGAKAPEIRVASWTRILYTSVEGAVRMIPGLGTVVILVPPPTGVTGEGYGLDPHGKP